MEELKIKVKVSELREKVAANRGAHRAIFEEAVEAYRARLLQELEARIERVRNGKPIEMHIRLPEPEDHTEDYDRALEMLEMHASAGAETIEIGSGDFAELVRDDWAWKRAWFANTASYTAAAGRR